MSSNPRPFLYDFIDEGEEISRNYSNFARKGLVLPQEEQKLERFVDVWMTAHDKAKGMSAFAEASDDTYQDMALSQIAEYYLVSTDLLEADQDVKESAGREEGVFEEKIRNRNIRYEEFLYELGELRDEINSLDPEILEDKRWE